MRIGVSWSGRVVQFLKSKGDKKMKAGDRIRLDVGRHGMYSDLQDFIVEEFRYCLGIFRDDDHRKAGKFTPLCDLYEPGPESKEDYISHFGPYHTDMVQFWMNLP